MKHTWRTLITTALITVAGLIAPLHVYAQELLKHPLAYSLREYMFILGVALFGGLAKWVRRVKKGDVEMLSFSALVGELVISAFAGLLTFWGCAALGISPLWTAAAAGIAGHAGGAGVEWMEKVAKRYAERRFGLNLTGPAPLDDK